VSTPRGRRGTPRAIWIGAAIALCAAAMPGALVEKALAAATSLAPVTAGLSPDSISGVPGQTRAVALRVDLGTTGKVLGSYSVTLEWDSTVVRLDSARAGDFGAPLVNYVNGGELRLTQANAQGVGGVVTVATLHFRFIGADGARTPIATTFGDMAATDFTDLLAMAEVKPGVARILAPAIGVAFSPDDLAERVGFKPVVDLLADLSQAGGTSLGSYTAELTWDAGIMVLDSIGLGDFAPPQTVQPAAGVLRLTAADGQGVGGGAVALARLYFSFVSSNFPQQTFLDAAVSEMHEARSFADLLGGVTIRRARFVIAGVLRGDIDVSGSVAALDAQLILQGVVGLPLQGLAGTPNGDADCGGTLGAKDAQIVLNLVVGNDVSAFCAGRIQ
jgi:hypothetical protein